MFRSGRQAGFATAAIAAVFVSGFAEARLVRGSAGTSLDSQGTDVVYYITATEPPLGSIGDADQAWTGSFYARPVPDRAPDDTDCILTDGSVLCGYEVRAGDSRRLRVTGGAVGNLLLLKPLNPDDPPEEWELIVAFPTESQTEPRVDMVWRVRHPVSNDVIREFVFEDVPSPDPAGPTLGYYEVDLVLNGIPASPVPADPEDRSQDYRLEVAFTYSLPDAPECNEPDFLFYRVQGNFSGDIRQVIEAVNLGCEISTSARTFLRIEEGAIDADVTPPVTTATLDPPANAAGWHSASPVTVSLSATDADGSGVEFIAWEIGSGATSTQNSSPNSTASFQVSDQGVVPVSYYAVDKEGNEETPNDLTVRIDLTNPSISPTVVPAANAAGWNNTAVTVSFACNDSLSGVASCSEDSLLSTEGANQSVTGSAVDVAGNTSSATVSGIDIDLTAPSIIAQRAPEPNTAGWNNTAVTVLFLCDDALSGVPAGGCPGGVMLTEDGASQQVSGTVMDRAGNSAMASVSGINIDRTAPTITGAPTTEPNEAGWYRTDIRVEFECADALSGVDACGPDFTLTDEGEGQSVEGRATDLAGNSADFTVGGLNIDRTPPMVSVSGVEEGDQFILGAEPPAPGCETEDVLSGVAVEASLVVTGGTVNGVGSFTASCSGAQDIAGNPADTVSVGYQVTYEFTGFLQPIENFPVINRVRAGQSVPVKFSLGGDFGLDILAAAAVRQINCPDTAVVSDVAETATSAGRSSLSYDPLTGQYTYAWQTARNFARSCRMLEITLDDGETREAYFEFR